MNLNLLEQDLEEVDKNIIYLSNMRNDLVYNINLHKSGEVVSVMREYKKSVDELEIVRNELIKYENHRRTIEQKLSKKIESYDYYLNEYYTEYENINSENVILLFRKIKK